MQQYLIVLGIFAIIYLIYYIWKKKKSNALIDELYKVLLNNDEKRLNEICDSRLAKFLFTPYHLYYYKLNFYTKNDNEKKATEILKTLLPLKIRDKEKLSFLNLTFPYFLGKENKKMCEEIAPLIKTLSAKDKNAELICSEVDLLMDIYIHPNRERIAELRTLADENEGEVKAMYLERLAILYTMLDEMDNAKAAFDEAVPLVENAAYKAKLELLAEKIGEKKHKK